MPDTKSNDFGNIAGKIHSHSFPAANTALPMANHDEHQMEMEQNFLKSGAVSIDIFAVSNASAKDERRGRSASGAADHLRCWRRSRDEDHRRERWRVASGDSAA